MRMRWLAGADRRLGAIYRRHVCIGACMSPVIDDATIAYIDDQADIREWDLVAVRDGDRILIKQLALLNGEPVMLSTLPPVRLKDRVIVGKVVAISDRPRRLLRWLLRKQIAAAERESAEFTALCMAKMREAYRTDHPTFPTWEPARLQFA